MKTTKCKDIYSYSL